jgi:hypothetical protein
VILPIFYRADDPEEVVMNVIVQGFGIGFGMLFGIILGMLSAAFVLTTVSRYALQDERR